MMHNRIHHYYEKLYRHFLLFTGSLLLFVTVQAQSAKPNIIFIISDDQGYHDLGSYGNKEIKTPHLDQLAAEGVCLTNFYVTGSGCTPSRSGLLTGRYPQRNGTFELFRNDMVNYGHQYSAYEYSVSPERILGTDTREVFISEVLKKAGYTNGYIGKWDLGQLKRFLPLQRGFDFFYGFANTGIDYFTHERYGIHSMIRGNELTEKDKGTYSTDLFEREAIRFIQEYAKGTNAPFFLYLSFNAPHLPSTLDQEQKGLVQATDEFLGLYPEPRTPEQKKRRAYMAAVTHMDKAIGRVLQELRNTGQDKNTLIIFQSDNGGSLGHADNYPLKGGKAQFFEGGIRVPCIVKWPGKIGRGLENHDFLSALEMFPMLTHAAGAELPDSVIYDGFDMLSVLQGTKRSEREHMFWEFRSDTAARVGDWKWVRSKRGNGLYNLADDVGENNDLSAKHPEIVQKMEAAFTAWRKTMDEAEPRGPFRDF